MSKNGSYEDLPLGLGMALMQNIDALNNFVTLSDAQKKAVIEKAGAVDSRQEMHSFVNEIGQGSFLG